MADRGSCGCCGWLCGLCCCCCGHRTRETSPLLSSSTPGGKGQPEMSRVQVVASADGQSETQKIELAVHSHDDDEEEDTVQPNKDMRQSRVPSITSRDPPQRDPATSTTFVRGSSGRSSWRMVPHPKRQSQISVRSEAEEQQQAVNASTHNTETSEVTLEMVAMAPETPPPPLKDYRLTQSYEDDRTQASGERGEEEGGGIVTSSSSGERGEEEGGGIVHTSSFSFSAREGRVVGTH